MLEGLQTEIDLHPELTGASPRIIIEALNKPGSASVESWVISIEPVMISKSDLFIIYLSQPSRIALREFMSGTTQLGQDIKMIMDEVEGKGINLSLEPVRDLLKSLNLVGVGTDDEYNRLMRKGEVLKSRSEELFDRKITLEDFE